MNTNPPTPQKRVPAWLAAIGCAVPLLLLAGCEGSGGGTGAVGSLLSGGTGGSAAELLGGGGSGDSLSAPPVAIVHQPEPASLALFGGGLAGLAWCRRRRARRRTRGQTAE